MQRFRQPQKIQGPLFPIEDDELIDAINDYKNISDEDVNKSEDNKTNVLYNEFDAESQVEVIEIDDIYMDNSDYKDENDTFINKNNRENVSKSVKIETEKTVNMFCKLSHINYIS